MYVVLITTLFALLLTHFESKGKIRNGLFWGFVMLTTLGVIHYDYGNDYMAYLNMYHEFNKYQFNFEYIINGDYFTDPGWTILCHAFSMLGGFFVMVAVLNIIQNILVYRFIRSNINKTWWTMAVFIYTCSTNLYLMNFSMMRQGLVVCIFLGVWELIKNKKCWWALLVLYISTFIHKSSIILLPFAFLGFLPKGKGKTWAIVFSVLLLLLWYSGAFLNTIFSSFMDIEEIQGYIETYSDGEITATYGIGFVLNLIPLVVGLYYLMTNKDHDCNQKIVIISMISFIITPFAQIIPLVGRIGTYFSIYKIAAFPLIYSSVKNHNLRYGLLFIFIFMTLYDYWNFFNVGVFAEHYSTFHTIFEVL